MPTRYPPWNSACTYPLEKLEQVLGFTPRPKTLHLFRTTTLPLPRSCASTNHKRDLTPIPANAAQTQEAATNQLRQLCTTRSNAPLAPTAMPDTMPSETNLPKSSRRSPATPLSLNKSFQPPQRQQQQTKAFTKTTQATEPTEPTSRGTPPPRLSTSTSWLPPPLHMQPWRVTMFRRSHQALQPSKQNVTKSASMLHTTSSQSSLKHMADSATTQSHSYVNSATPFQSQNKRLRTITPSNNFPPPSNCTTPSPSKPTVATI